VDNGYSAFARVLQERCYNRVVLETLVEGSLEVPNTTGILERPGAPMPSSVLHKASDLPPDIREAVVRLLGRQLKPEEHISVMAYEPHAAPTGADRTELAVHLKDRIAKTAAKMKDVPEDELDELIDEAVDHVRHHRP